MDQKAEDDVVKYFINDRFHVGLSTLIRKKADFFLQPGIRKQNNPYYVLIDGDKEVKNIYKMGDIREYFDSRVQESDSSIFSALLRMDQNRLVVERNNFTIRTWLAETGGIFNIIYSIFYLLCFFIGRYIFINKMLGEMFYIKPIEKVITKEEDQTVKGAYSLSKAKNEKKGIKIFNQREEHMSGHSFIEKQLKKSSLA